MFRYLQLSLRLSAVFFLASVFVVLPLYSSGKSETSADSTICVYSYDSFASDWGPAQEITEGFFRKTGIKAEVISCGSEGELVSRLLLEGDKTGADFVIGISGSHKEKVASMFDSLETFDFGVFSVNFDTESGLTPPECLEDLLKSEYSKKLILIDPRTSSVGLGLLQWTQALFGDKALDWWREAGKNALTVSDSWSAGYGLYTAGEAPMVISYTTSPVYHIMNENTDRYVSLTFKQGHVKTEEMCGVIRTSARKEQAKLFEQYILNEGQQAIAVANSMYPANPDTELPQAFSSTPVPSVILEFDDNKVAELLDEWAKVMR